jgi:hypothetical protein
MPEPAKKQFGGAQEGAGRKELPPSCKKDRVVAYVLPDVKKWIEANGGSTFAAKILADAHKGES